MGSVSPSADCQGGSGVRSLAPAMSAGRGGLGILSAPTSMLTDTSRARPARTHITQEESGMSGLVTRRLFSSEPRSAFRDLGSLHREIDALFEGVFGNRAVEPVADWAPRVDTYVKDDALHVRADLPAVDPKAVDISIDGDVLTITRERMRAIYAASDR